MNFVDCFGSDPRENQHRWERHPNNPIIRCDDKWAPDFIAPCSLVETDDDLVLYVEGGARDWEHIGEFHCSRQRVWESEWAAFGGNPVLSPSERGFDRGSVFDPAVIDFAGTTRMYYSATSAGAHEFGGTSEATASDEPEDEQIGMAVMQGPGRFERRTDPVLQGRCPAVIEWQGLLYMFFVRVVEGGFRIYLAKSTDGIAFAPAAEEPVLDVGAPGTWDSFTVTTPKVFPDGGQFVMLYAGDDRSIDDPTAVGIAVSDDLVNWRKHSGNPVFVTGAAGEFDSTVVAATVPFYDGGSWYILYGGCDRTIVEGLHSQVGLARLKQV